MRTGDPNEHPPDPHSELHGRFHGPLMSFFLRRVKIRAEAEDLTQEVLLRALRADGLQRADHADAFIFKIAINLLRDRQRQTFRRGNPDFIPLEEAERSRAAGALVEDLSPERVLLSRDSLAEVLRALDELGEMTRNIFILFRLENMKQKDIAALYGIGQSTVEKHVMKATLHLAVRFDGKMGD